MPVPVSVSGVFGLPPDSPFLQWVQKAQQMVNRLGEGRSYEVLVPVTGFTHVIPNATGVCLLTPAGVLATGTLTLPAQASDGFRQHILTSQTVTALTVTASSGQTIVGSTAFALSAGVEVVYFFVASTSTWYKMR
jgi:hypothetical protein